MSSSTPTSARRYLTPASPYIAGYKPRSNYQALLAEVLAERMTSAAQLQEVAAADADRPMVVPEVDEILAVLTAAPKPSGDSHKVAESSRPGIRLTTNYIEREARNRSLGAAGELFALNYERARLIHVGKESLCRPHRTHVEGPRGLRGLRHPVVRRKTERRGSSR